MFRKKIKQQPAISEPERKERVITPCEDEPDEWAQLTEPQLAETWYRLESLSVGDEKAPQINDQDNFKWYLNAANQGDRCAQYALGKMFQRGILTHAVLFQAGLWYSKASNAGSPFADYELAKMCEYGITMNKDADMADKLYRKACQSLVKIEHRNPNRAVEKKLAALCNKDVFADPQEAAHWKQLAEQQTRPAQSCEKLPAEPSQEIRNDEQSRKKSDRNANAMCLQDIPVEYIFPAKSNQYAERDTEQSIHALAMSIQVHGLISPLTVNKISESEYRIIAGEKRYKAITQLLHWPSIPVIVKDNLTSNASQSMLNAANLDVRDYSAGEKLQFYIENERLLRKMKESGKYSGPMQEGIAELLGVSSHQIRKYQRIVEMLPPKRLKQVKDGTLSIEKAYKMTLHPSVDRHPSAADSPENPVGRTSGFKEKADVVGGQKINRISVPENVLQVRENPIGRTSGFEGKSDVIGGQKISRISVSEDVLQVREILGNPAGRTSGFEGKADVVGGQKISRISIPEDVPKAPEILENPVGRTSGFEGKSDVVEGQKISRVSVSGDIPQIPENPVGRTSGFEGKADVVEGQKISRISVPENVPQIPENPVGRTSGFEGKADVVEGQKISPISAPEDVSQISENPVGRTSGFEGKADVVEGQKISRISVPEDVLQTPENQDGCASFQEPENYVEAVHLLKNLPVKPGQCCEVLQDEDKVPGIIDRIELYENALIISVLVNNIRRPYPVSKIGTDLILGSNASA